METQENFDQLATTLLFSDVELGLTFTEVALSYPEGERRRMALRHAAAAYRQIRQLMAQVEMSEARCAALNEKLDMLQAALESAGDNPLGLWPYLG